MSSLKVLILMGSDSDLPKMTDAVRTLRDFGIDYELRVLSVHRAPAIALQTGEEARKKGFGAIIAAAGSAAHLAGALAAKTTLPVIGVPIENGALRGLDALYSTVQMPPGVPVATVGINASKNAALLAIQMLAIRDEDLAAKLDTYKSQLVDQVLEKDRRAQEKLRDEGLA